MPSRKNDALRKEQQNLVEQIANIVSEADEAPPSSQPFPGKRADRILANLRRPLLVSASSLLLIGFGSALAFAVSVAALERQAAQLQDLRRYTATLEKRLADYHTAAAPIRDLPPPYPEVRSGFPDWRICTTDDCGAPRNEPF